MVMKRKKEEKLVRWKEVVAKGDPRLMTMMSLSMERRVERGRVEVESGQEKVKG